MLEEWGLGGHVEQDLKRSRGEAARPQLASHEGGLDTRHMLPHHSLRPLIGCGGSRSLRPLGFHVKYFELCYNVTHHRLPKNQTR